MKYRTTNKALRADRRPLVSIGYCDAQYLLKNRTPEAYTAGVYGWNCDVYSVGRALVCTGYRPPNGIQIDYKKLCDAEQQARNASPEEADALLITLVEEVTK